MKRIIAAKDNYREWDEPKVGGGTRHIESPSPALKLIQGKLANMLGSITPPAYLYCPVRGRSAFDNACVHRGSRVIRNIDIQRFFPSTTESRVFWFFSKYMGCSKDVSYQLSKIACFQQHLPTGSPLSPILAHFAYRDMWDEIDRLCRLEDVRFTVWIDDLTLSGDSVGDQLIWAIKRLICKYALRYHKERKSIAHPARVTGVILGPKARMTLPHRHHLRLYQTEVTLDGIPVHFRGAREKLEGRLRGLQGHSKQLERARSRSG
jgi:hypothetical protein